MKRKIPRLNLAGSATVLALLTILASAPLKAVTWLGLDPNVAVGPARSNLYGMNLNFAMRPEKVTNKEYQEGLAYLNAPLIRYHAAESIFAGHEASWINAATQSWDASRINTSLSNLSYPVSGKLIAIAEWPSWMDTNGDGRLDPDKFQAYAEFCADLVSIVNLQQGHGVVYWEPFNELEGRYANDVATLAQIFNLCATAMKSRDPSIKIVGAAWTQPWAPSYPGTFKEFIGLVKANLDVCSYHQYGTGDGSLSPAAIYNTIPALLEGATAVRGYLDHHGLQNVPLWLTEHNIFWSWESDYQFRMTQITGGVFDALLLTQFTRQGILDAAFSWIDADTRYGKIGFNWNSWTYDQLNPGAHVYHYFNRFAVGQVVQSSPSQGSVQTFATKDPSRNLLSLVLINRSGENQLIYLGNSTAYNWETLYQITESGVQTSTLNSLAWRTLPPHSVSFAIGGLGSQPTTTGGGSITLQAEAANQTSASVQIASNDVFIPWNGGSSAWIDFSNLQIPANAQYDLTIRYASFWGGMNVDVQVGGQTIGTFNQLPQTWDANGFRQETLSNISLPSGNNQTLRLLIQNGEIRIDYLELKQK
ncbi:MAG: carbohydrate-binding protein [Puniceicoccaceae bacterium]